MRIVSLLMVLAGAAVTACGGGTADVPGGPTGGAAAGSDTPKAAGSEDPTSSNPSKGDVGPKVAGADCPTPTSVLVASGGAIARPAGSALRLRLVYQGSSIGVTNIRGVDMILSPNDGPFTPGDNSGYWVETRSATSSVYQRLFRDPTNQEAPAGPNGGDFSSSTIDRCTPKIISADVPNDASATELRIYGSPYGTQGGAVELARFAIQ